MTTRVVGPKQKGNRWFKMTNVPFFQKPPESTKGTGSPGLPITPVAGLIFETKNREIFLERSLQEKSLQKNRSIFGLKNQSCDRRYVLARTLTETVRRSEHPFHFCVLTLSHARNVLAKFLCSISTGIMCSRARSTLGQSPAMTTS